MLPICRCIITKPICRCIITKQRQWDKPKIWCAQELYTLKKTNAPDRELCFEYSLQLHETDQDGSATNYTFHQSHWQWWQGQNPVERRVSTAKGNRFEGSGLLKMKVRVKPTHLTSDENNFNDNEISILTSTKSTYHANILKEILVLTHRRLRKSKAFQKTQQKLTRLRRTKI